MKFIDGALNEEREFETKWTVDADYLIEHDCEESINSSHHHRAHVLFPQGGLTHEYQPSIHKELPAEIAKLRHGDEEAILGFARIYGSFAYYLSNDNLYDFLKTDKIRDYAHGDPIPWIVAHGHIIYFCLSLIEQLRNDDLDNLKCTMKDFYNKLKTDLSIRSWVPRLIFRDPIHQNTDLPGSDYGILHGVEWLKESLEKPNNLKFVTQYILASIINWRVKNISIQISHDDFQIKLFYRSLIDVAYWHLAIAASNGVVKKCEGCGSFFIQIDPRQKFCPPKGRSRESSCSIKERVKMFRNKKKAKQLNFDGLSVKSIAEKLDIKPEVIKEWIGEVSRVGKEKGGKGHGKTKCEK